MQITRMLARTALIVSAGALGAAAQAQTVYWNLFNFEGETAVSAVYATYGSLDDMLLDQNRTGNFTPSGGGAGQNIVGTGSDGSAYWNLFNFEAESEVSAVYATYGSLDDMLLDQNRTGNFTPSGGGAGRNVVGTGSNGRTYWNLFNFEGETEVSAVYATYASLGDMLLDQNRTGNFTPSGGGAGRNVVDASSNGSTYWTLFNFEEESAENAVFATYASLDDLFLDQNRTGNFTPSGGGAGRNIIGSGSVAVVPEPGTWATMVVGFAAVGGGLRVHRRRRAGSNTISHGHRRYS